jgi:hypothetical protein
MHYLSDSIVPLRVLALLAVLACSGCTDITSLCEARLTPINLSVPAVAPPQSGIVHR